MAQKRPKRLPTDFFDRLLSNQTDDQINDLLTSLVDEQIMPTAEPALAPMPSAPSQESHGMHRGFHRDKIEDSIVTRDEELDEIPLVDDQDSALDELIPRTKKMQTAARPAQEPAELSEPPLHPEYSAPEESQAGRVKLPGLENLEVPPELLEDEQPAAYSGYEAPPVPEVPPEASPIHGDATFSDHDFLPPEVPLPPDVPEAPPETHAYPPPMPDTPSIPEMPAEPPIPLEDMAAAFRVEAPPEPVSAAAVPMEAEPAEEAPAEALKPVFASLPSHEQLLRARIQARWESPARKPKLPKLAKPSAPVVIDLPRPDKMAGILGDLDKPKQKFKFTRMSRAALTFLLPAFIAFSLFSWYPMIKGLFISLYEYHPTGVSTFVGVQNYVRAFSDVMFLKTLWHALKFCVLVLLLGFSLPIMLSVFINELRWGRGLLKFVFFLPFLMPAVPAAILWKWIMDQGLGLLNALLSFLPLADPHIGWLTNPNLALISIVLVYIWKNTGWAILIYSAALGNIDETLYEEAEMDGATLWDKVRHVTLPGLRSVIAVMFIITVINTLQLFTEVYIMTNGGPMNSTEVIATYIYKQAFFYMDIGYASALSMILLMMLLVFTLLRLRRLDSDGG